MNITLNYTKESLKFLCKQNILNIEIARSLIRKAVNKVILGSDENIDLMPLAGEFAGMYRIRYRNVRIIFYLITTEKTEEVLVFISDIDFRGNIYKK